ncbi:MAG: S41 family peptidase [Candidatus Cryptobacteroides sp.]
MKKVLFALFLFILLPAHGQNVSQFKDVPLGKAVDDQRYVDGNKYQKDAMLFMDMLASTHPYYIKADRRDELFSRMDGLLADCAVCESDAMFVELLRAAMPEVRDKHTDIIDAESFMSKKNPKKEVQEQGGRKRAGRVCALDNNGQLFSYRILGKESVCYMQFNQCNDARTLRDESLPRFDKMLDEMFAEMEKEGIATLIVDVQYNNGGSSRLCDELLDRLCPLSEIRMLDTYMRFSPLLALYNPKAEKAMKVWEEAGHCNELYPMPQKKMQIPIHEYYQGKVVFIQGPRTFSSAGILITTARDNKIGTIIGTESTFSPSHYGEVLPFRLPNTGVLGSVCTKYFERPDKEHADDRSLVPDVVLNLDNKASAWRKIIRMYSSKK